MTIEEVEELRKQEMNKTLRYPNISINKENIESVFYLQYCVCKLVNEKFFISKLINKTALRKCGIEICGNGTREMPYIIKSEFWEGMCFNIKYIFKDRKCPFKKGHCFGNAFQIAAVLQKMSNVDICECVSGIALINQDDETKSILHSIVELNGDWVLDVNIGMVISKELYYKLFMFEELVKIDGKKIPEVIKLMSQERTNAVTKKFNLKTYHMVYALEDMIDFIQNESRQDNHQRFGELDY